MWLSKKNNIFKSFDIRMLSFCIYNEFSVSEPIPAAKMTPLNHSLQNYPLNLHQRIFMRSNCIVIQCKNYRYKENCVPLETEKNLYVQKINRGSLCLVLCTCNLAWETCTTIHWASSFPFPLDRCGEACLAFVA